MMRILSFVLCLLLSVAAFANGLPTKDKSHPISAEDAVSFIRSHQIDPDSCYIDLYKNIASLVGTRYRYSGRNADSGLDCSGFAKIIYNKVFKIQLNASSASIFTQTQALSKEELEIGDLVFFKIRKNRISHVGIYLGNNKFAHAAVKGGVRIDSLNTPYYKRTFYKGGRVSETSQ